MALQPPVVRAQAIWSVDIGLERSSVVAATTHATWETLRLQTARISPAEGGFLIAVERQRRGSLVDAAIAGSGYRRFRDWTVQGGLAAGVDAEFLYRSSAELEVSRRIVGTTVASFGGRLLDFAAVNVLQFLPALSWNHAHGEVLGRLYLTRRDTPDLTSATALISTWFDAHRRVRLSASLAYGDRIFDVASLAAGASRARAVHARARTQLAEKHYLEVGVGVAHEAPSFDQRTVSLTYRRTF